MASIRRIVIVSGSSRITERSVGKMPAIERYDGLFVRVAKKSIEEAKRKDIDLLILSPVLGLLEAGEEVDYHKPVPGGWRKLELSEKEIEELRRRNSIKLKDLMKKHAYSEVYVNVGKNYLPQLDFSVLSNTKITFAVGSGPGPKSAHMKAWLHSIPRK